MERPNSVRSGSVDSYGSEDDNVLPKKTTNKRKRADGDSSVNHRKEQNRVAQREFRQRKQKYIQGLEARLALHESSRDEQIDQLREGIAALIEENQQLRKLLASVSGFIGDNIGGMVTQLGITHPEFQELITREKGDHALNTLAAIRERRPKNTSQPSAVIKPTEPLVSPAMMNLPPLGFPDAASAISNPIPNYNLKRSLNEYILPVDNTKFTQNMQASGVDSRTPISKEQLDSLASVPTDDPKLQAIQLIAYHLINKRNQPSYHLPPSLKATVTQQTVPHDSFLDGIIFTSLRDRLILLKDQYDSTILTADFLASIRIHNEDILQPSNWELSETFLRKYWYVIDHDVLAICNRWRRERGEAELTLRSIVPDSEDIQTEGILGKKYI